MSRKHEISFIVSIHQPNLKVLDIFDNLYVLSKGGVNVYSGPPQSLRQHLNDCHIDCNENEIAIERVLKICANDSSHSSIVDMREKTRNMLNNSEKQMVEEMKIKVNVKSNRMVKFSLPIMWYLLQRRLIVYSKILSVVFLFVILSYAMMAYILSSFYNTVPPEYRDCQLDNSTQQCIHFVYNNVDLKNVKYEVRYIFGLSLTPFTLIALWTSLVMSNEINTYLWENQNGKNVVDRNRYNRQYFSRELNLFNSIDLILALS